MTGQFPTSGQEIGGCSGSIHMLLAVGVGILLGARAHWLQRVAAMMTLLVAACNRGDFAVNTFVIGGVNSGREFI